MSKRALVCNLAARMGLTRLLERFARQPALLIFVYHRVMQPEDCPYDRGVVEATPEQFDDQMTLLRKRYPVATLDEVFEFAANPSSLKHFHVMVTFDDCYRDNYEIAFPILKSHGVPATFFAPTAFVGTRRMVWWDQIAAIVRQCRHPEIVLDQPRPATIPVSPEGMERAVYDVLEAYKDAGTADEARFIAQLEQSCACSMPRDSGKRMYLTWEQAREMADAGMAFGSHTHQHRILARLTEEEQAMELRTSRALMEQNLGRPCKALAYPVGNVTTFSHVTKDCLRQAGYQFAFSNYGGVNTPDNMSRLDLLRVDMDLAEDIAQFRFRAALAGTTRKSPW
jgi:peptidoglycan/xylan/chitin deacetylase (PgdA/CDA1 family)